MIKIGVIIRGKYGNRLIDAIKLKPNFKLFIAKIPKELPDFIEDPDEFLDEINFNFDVFKAEIIISYALHPDINLEIAEIAGMKNVNALIITKGESLFGELEKISKKYGIFIEVDSVCCSIKERPETKKFTQYFGTPAFKIKTDKDKIIKVEVVRCAPCGATEHVANNLIGVSIKDAPSKAGLLCQHYPCYAVRGIKKGIHESAEIHKQAMIDALSNEKS